MDSDEKISHSGANCAVGFFYFCVGMFVVVLSVCMGQLPHPSHYVLLPQLLLPQLLLPQLLLPLWCPFSLSRVLFSLSFLSVFLSTFFNKKYSSMMVTLYVLNEEFDEASVFRQWFIPNLVICCLIMFPKVFGKSVKEE